MSKYIKLQDAIKSVADQYMFEASIENTQSCDDIKEWEKVASRLFSDLPKIEVSEDCISRSALISFIDAGHLRNPNEKCYIAHDRKRNSKSTIAIVIVLRRGQGRSVSHGKGMARVTCRL